MPIYVDVTRRCGVKKLISNDPGSGQLASPPSTQVNPTFTFPYGGIFAVCYGFPPPSVAANSDTLVHGHWQKIQTVIVPGAHGFFPVTGYIGRDFVLTIYGAGDISWTSSGTPDFKTNSLFMLRKSNCEESGSENFWVNPTAGAVKEAKTYTFSYPASENSDSNKAGRGNICQCYQISSECFNVFGFKASGFSSSIGSFIIHGISTSAISCAKGSTCAVQVTNAGGATFWRTKVLEIN